MAKTINQRELRNHSRRIMKALDRGEVFVVTRNGIAVAELRPVTRGRFVPTAAAIAAFSGAPRIDPDRFRRDLNRVLDQDPTPLRPDRVT